MDKIVFPNNVLLDEASELMAEGKTVNFTPKGNSMLPFIRGSLDSTLVAHTDNVEVGDIVLAKISGKYIMHRVFEVEGDKVTLMGDGNLGAKEHCLNGNAVGKVLEIHRGDKVIVPGKGKLWRMLLPVRRYLLFIYRKTHPRTFIPVKKQLEV